MTTLTTPNHTQATDDESIIRGMIDRWTRALEAKDADAIVADYAPDALLYDAIAPWKVQGARAIRDVWAACLPHFPASFKSEHRDLKLVVGDTVAYCHGLHHFTTDEPGHPLGKSWMRVTACYRKIDGAWKVAHEHVSMPFDCHTDKVVAIVDPDAA